MHEARSAWLTTLGFAVPRLAALFIRQFFHLYSAVELVFSALFLFILTSCVNVDDSGSSGIFVTFDVLLMVKAVVIIRVDRRVSTLVVPVLFLQLQPLFEAVITDVEVGLVANTIVRLESRWLLLDTPAQAHLLLVAGPHLHDVSYLGAGPPHLWWLRCHHAATRCRFSLDARP